MRFPALAFDTWAASCFGGKTYMLHTFSGLNEVDYHCPVVRVLHFTAKWRREDSHHILRDICGRHGTLACGLEPGTRRFPAAHGIARVVGTSCRAVMGIPPAAVILLPCPVLTGGRGRGGQPLIE